MHNNVNLHNKLHIKQRTKDGQDSTSSLMNQRSLIRKTNEYIKRKNDAHLMHQSGSQDFLMEERKYAEGFHSAEKVGPSYI
jgi:hypothetical protein